MMFIPSHVVRRMVRTARERKGFALPLTILVIVALTATLAAAFASVTAEIATNSAQRSEGRAFLLAESGLEEYIARRTYHCTARTGYASPANFACGSPPNVLAESVTVTLSGGYARVTATKAQSGFGAQRGAVFLIISRGVDTSAAFSGGSRAVFGERIVAQYASWNQKTIQVLSALTSLAGVAKTGASGIITGNDNCPAAQGGGLPPLAGISAPNGDIVVSGSVTAGNPPQAYMGTQAQADSAVKIDWAGIVRSPSIITADWTFPYSTSVPAGLVARWSADPNYYPVIHVTGQGDWDLPSGGRGFLIIDGNPYMGHGGWNGVILSGGTVRGNGTDVIKGAMITGMNMKLTPSQLTAAGLTPLGPTDGDDLRGVKNYYFNSCEVAKAGAALGSFVVMPNAWMDNFTTY
ncbi:MAG: hypothetical protein ABIT20_09455 [Gemmatimonadaceae bacterium]